MPVNRPDFRWDRPDALIQVRQLDKFFVSAAGKSHVLKRIDLDVNAGEFVSIIGRSGSGKSTLINMLSGIDHLTSGSVRIGDTLLYEMSEGQMAKWRGRMLGIVFQFFQLLPTLTLLENVLLPMDFSNMYEPSEREARALHLLDQVGLTGLADKLPGAVSGGQQQCAAVARALANDAPVLMADEPTGNLDSGSAEQVLALFEALVESGKTILMVTHDRELARRASRTVLISDGEIVDGTIMRAFAGLPDEALLHLSRESVRETFQPGQALAEALLADSNWVWVIGKGAIQMEGFARFPGHGAAERIEAGQWLDLRRLPPLRRRGASLRATQEGALEALRIPAGRFDALTKDYVAVLDGNVKANRRKP